jgi:hypothetical protein
VTTTKPERRRPSLTANPEPIVTSSRIAAAADVGRADADERETAPAAAAKAAPKKAAKAGPRGGSRTRTARDAASGRDPLTTHRRLVEVEARRFAAKTEKLAGPVADFAAILATARDAGMSAERLREILANVDADVDALRRLADDLAKYLA